MDRFRCVVRRSRRGLFPPAAGRGGNGRWCRGLLLASTLLGPVGTRADEPAAVGVVPALRIDAAGFDAREADIRAVLDSAAGELWRFFPDHRIEPIVVMRGRESPITLFQRNDQGEVVILLNTEKTFWSQYAYQFSHELCHVLCGTKPGYRSNRWFEETLCETASLFTMRAMAKRWKDAPPFPNWRDYRDSLRDYTDEIVRRRDTVYELYAVGLPAYFRNHRTALEKEPGLREVNGAMSVVLLQLFEDQPERWETVRWLNAAASDEAEPFSAYLQKWHDSVPPRHRPFVHRVADLYGMPILPAPSTGESR